MSIDVFDLKAKISLDSSSYEKGLEQSKSLFHKFGDGLKSAAGAVGNVLADVAKGATVAIGAAGTALTALTKQSLDIYANFEQLEGGTKLMFGEAADFIIQKSEEAYKTVQLSQNEYLQQVNGFAVGLKTALGGNEQAAAELADKIVQAEADIVAATGNTQEMVQNAFNGIMRSNYTMLDNLGLGIKPTKEGMEEVITKVNEWNAAQGKASEYAIDNLADVQAALVDYIEMQGMAGYASMEAGSTITGSIAGVKAAWQNFLSGNGNVKDFTDMLIPTVKNIRGKLDVIIPRLTEGLEILVDELAPHVPELIEETLPTIIDGASSLLEGVSSRLPQLITTILPAVANGVVNVSVALVGALPDLIGSLKKSIPIVIETIMSKKDELLKAGKDIIKAIFPDKIDTQAMTDITKTATSVIGQFALAITDPKNLKIVTDNADSIINALIDGLLSEESLDAFIENAPKIIENLVEGIKTVLLGSEQDGEGGLFGAAKKIIQKLGDYFADDKNRQNFIESADKIIRSIGKGLISVLQNGVAPLMVEVARAWAECFAGSIDYYDTANDIIKRLGEAFVHNMISGGILGKWIDEAAEKNMQENYDDHIESSAASADEELAIRAKADYMRRQGYPDIAVNEYIKTATQRGYAANGFLATKPTLLSNTVVGEAGDEALLPLDSNTGWMDKLAEKLGAKMGGGIIIENVTIHASGNGADIADSFIARMDEMLENRHISQSRGIGATGW